MSGFAEYRRNQKALEHGLTKEGGSVWEEANQEFIQKHWQDAQRIYSEKFPAADIDADYDEFTDPDLHQRLVNAGWPKEKIEEIKGVMKASRLNREAEANKKKKPIPPPILRYPYEGMTQHTDYLQIDIVQYKPVGNRKGIKEVKEWGNIGTQIIKGSDGTEYEDKIAGDIIKRVEVQAKFKGKMGGRRNTKNRLVGNTRSYALSTIPLKNEGTILLPIPSNVQDGNSVKVGDNSLNGLQAAGASGVMDAMNTSVDKVTGFKDAANTIATGLAGAAQNFSSQVQEGATLDAIKNVALNKLTASALGIFGGNVTVNQLMARQSGEIINPNMELLFDGPTLRAFKFQFKMTPRNEFEAKQIRLIIRAFKRNMAPIAKGGTENESAWFLKTPNVFELRYRTGNKDHDYLHKFKQCFLTDIAVNYTGEGVYSTYEDGSPVSYLMDLSFKELEPIYDIDYDAVKDHDSVGY